jgi:hypothetical protein
MTCKTTSVTGRHNPPLFLIHIPLFTFYSLRIQERILQVASTGLQLACIQRRVPLCEKRGGRLFVMAHLGNFIPGAPVRFGIMKEVVGGLIHLLRPLMRPPGSENRGFMGTVLAFQKRRSFQLSLPVYEMGRDFPDHPFEVAPGSRLVARLFPASATLSLVSISRAGERRDRERW